MNTTTPITHWEIRDNVDRGWGHSGTRYDSREAAQAAIDAELAALDEAMPANSLRLWPVPMAGDYPYRPTTPHSLIVHAQRNRWDTQGESVEDLFVLAQGESVRLHEMEAAGLIERSDGWRYTIRWVDVFAAAEAQS